jgi:hypothetical protein
MRTVVEVYTLLPEVDDDQLQQALDSALEAIRKIQRAYGGVTGHPPLLATRHSLPSVVVFYEFDPETPPERRHERMHILPSHNRSFSDLATDEVLTPSQLAALDHIFARLNEGAPFRTGEVLLQTAQGAAHLFEDPMAAIVSMATGCEVLLDDLLSCMLWEEGKRPEDAAAIFNPSLEHRLRAGHHRQRLPGDWDLDGSGPIALWKTDVAWLRNAALHDGAVPTPAKAARALAVAHELLEFLRLRTLENVDAYPRTTWMLLGSDSVPETDRTRHVEPLLSDPGEPTWSTTSARWIRSMRYSLKHGEWSDQTSNPEDLALVAVRRPGHELFWCIVDERLERAFRIDDPSPWVDNSFINNFAAELPSTGPSSIRILAAKAEETPPLPTKGPWVAGYRLLPNVPVMVTGEHLDPT